MTPEPALATRDAPAPLTFVVASRAVQCWVCPEALVSVMPSFTTATANARSADIPGSATLALALMPWPVTAVRTGVV